jgi:hypothetical protein
MICSLKKKKTITPYFIGNHGWVGVEVTLSILHFTFLSFFNLIIRNNNHFSNSNDGD